MGFAVDASLDGNRQTESLAAAEDPSSAADERTQGRALAASADTSPGTLPPIASPTLLGMAGSATKSAVKFAASGFRTVDQETHQVRIDECAGCQYYNGSRCRVCGCFIDKKAWLPHEDCPIGKWPA